MSTLYIRPADLRAGDVVSVTEWIQYWNDAQPGMTLTKWDLLARVDCLEGNVWLAQNVQTCEQRVIEFKRADYYAHVVGGRAFADMQAGRGRVVDMGHFNQFIREG